ncbi:MAG TPA: hypothetical protein ENI86_11485 [Acidimicrobiales bacterium]|nr:hypothetical protein [Acidimicrobiales bacterium]
MAEEQSKNGLIADGRELVELLKDYARQETVGPLKGVGRYLAFGLAGSLLIAVAVVLLTLALLRALQTETGSVFTGSLNWIPYLITLLFVVLVASLATRAILKGGDGGSQ